MTDRRWHVPQASPDDHSCVLSQLKFKTADFRKWNNPASRTKRPDEVTAWNLRVKSKLPSSSDSELRHIVQRGEGKVSAATEQNTFSVCAWDLFWEGFIFMFLRQQRSIGHEMYHDTSAPLVTGHLWCLDLRRMRLALRLSCCFSVTYFQLLLCLEGQTSSWKHWRHLNFCFVKQ